MKALMKVLTVLFSTALVAVFAGLIYFWVNINSIAKGAIETLGTGITKTQVSVGSVNLSPLSGKGAIHKLEVANPPGFDSKDALWFKSMQVVVDLNSLNTDVVIIRSLKIKDAELNLEQKGLLSNNLNDLLDNLEEPFAQQSIANENSQETISSSKVKASRDKKIIIESFVLENSKLNIMSDLLGDKEVLLPKIALKDIGRHENGVTLQEATLQVFEPLMDETLNQADSEGFHFRGKSKQILENATQKIKEKSSELIDNILH